MSEKTIVDAEELIDLKISYEKLGKKYVKSLWALSELMGDNGIYISLGYKDLHFATFEELRKWIEDE